MYRKKSYKWNWKRSPYASRIQSINEDMVTSAIRIYWKEVAQEYNGGKGLVHWKEKKAHPLDRWESRLIEPILDKSEIGR